MTTLRLIQHLASRQPAQLQAKYSSSYIVVTLRNPLHLATRQRLTGNCHSQQHPREPTTEQSPSSPNAAVFVPKNRRKRQENSPTSPSIQQPKPDVAASERRTQAFKRTAAPSNREHPPPPSAHPAATRRFVEPRISKRNGSGSRLPQPSTSPTHSLPASTKPTHPPLPTPPALGDISEDEAQDASHSHANVAAIRSLQTQRPTSSAKSSAGASHAPNAASAPTQASTSPGSPSESKSYPLSNATGRPATPADPSLFHALKDPAHRRAWLLDQLASCSSFQEINALHTAVELPHWHLGDIPALLIKMADVIEQGAQHLQHQVHPEHPPFDPLAVVMGSTELGMVQAASQQAAGSEQEAEGEWEPDTSSNAHTSQGSTQAQHGGLQGGRGRQAASGTSGIGPRTAVEQLWRAVEANQEVLLGRWQEHHNEAASMAAAVTRLRPQDPSLLVPLLTRLLKTSTNSRACSPSTIAAVAVCCKRSKLTPYPSVIDKLLRTLTPELHLLPGPLLVDVLSCLHLWRHPPPQPWAAVVLARIKAQAPTLSLSNISAAISASAALDLQPDEDLLEDLLSRSQGLLASATRPHIHALLSALRHIDYLPAAPWCEICLRRVEILRSDHTQTDWVAQDALAAATLGMKAQPRWCTQLLRSYLAGEGFTAQGVAALLWSLQALVPAPRVWVSENLHLLEQLVLVAGDRLQWAAPLQLMQLAVGCANLGFYPGRRFMGWHEAACIRHKGEFPAQYLFEVRAAYLALRVKPQQQLEAMFHQARRRVMSARNKRPLPSMVRMAAGQARLAHMQALGAPRERWWDAMAAQEAA